MLNTVPFGGFHQDMVPVSHLIYILNTCSMRNRLGDIPLTRQGSVRHGVAHRRAKLRLVSTYPPVTSQDETPRVRVASEGAP